LDAASDTAGDGGGLSSEEENLEITRRNMCVTLSLLLGLSLLRRLPGDNGEPSISFLIVRDSVERLDQCIAYRV
jgi:hypothetical protein